MARSRQSRQCPGQVQAVGRGGGEDREVLKLRPDNAIAHNNLANVLLANGRVDEAIADYRQAIALAPDYADACNNLGTVFAGRGDLDGAVAQFRKALEIAPQFASAWEPGHGPKSARENRRSHAALGRTGTAAAERSSRGEPVGLGDGHPAGALGPQRPRGGRAGPLGGRALARPGAGPHDDVGIFAQQQQ